MKRSIRVKKLFQILSLCLVALGFATVLHTPPHAVAQSGADLSDGVYMLTVNVGKADLIILKSGDNAFMVDTGYHYTAPKMLTALSQMGIDTLKGVFITHNDKDHVGGLETLLGSSIKVETIYAPTFTMSSREKHPVLNAAAKAGKTVTFLNAGDVLCFDQDVFTVLAPLELNEDNDNNNSLVMTYQTPHGSILLTGDMKLDEEMTLLKAGTLQKCDVLKVPFHGDNSATSVSLLNIVKPRIAIIPTSTREEPDTPSPSVLRALAGIGCETYVTQDFADGILVILKEGTPVAKEATFTLPQAQTALSLSITLSSDILTISNASGEDISLSGMLLYSTRGEDVFPLKNTLVVPANGALTLVSSNSGAKADVVIPSTKRIWHKSKFDEAILYDAYGREIARTNNGMSE